MDWLLNDLGYLLGVIAEEAQHLVSIDWYRQNFVALVNIIMIDLVLAGDNAIIVGLAASRVPKEIRSRVIFWGIAAAVVLRIFFAAITVQLLAIIGLTLAGGLLLLWVCWKMYLQITTGSHHAHVDDRRGASTASSASGRRSASSPSPTCRCRSTTCWPSPAPPRARSSCWSSALPWRSS